MVRIHLTVISGHQNFDAAVNLNELEHLEQQCLVDSKSKHDSLGGLRLTLASD